MPEIKQGHDPTQGDLGAGQVTPDPDDPMEGRRFDPTGRQVPADDLVVPTEPLDDHRDDEHDGADPAPSRTG
jgi:hypothetical protein